jgi:hypothetical protein
MENLYLSMVVAQLLAATNSITTLAQIHTIQLPCQLLSRIRTVKIMLAVVS